MDAQVEIGSCRRQKRIEARGKLEVAKDQKVLGGARSGVLK